MTTARMIHTFMVTRWNKRDNVRIMMLSDRNEKVDRNRKPTYEEHGDVVEEHAKSE